MPEDPHKHLRRLERVWLGSPVYFVTTCTRQRRPVLAVAGVADILTAEWRAAGERHGWMVGRYVIMPDHVHFFCAAEHNAKTLSVFVGAWKEWTSKRIAREFGPAVAAGGDRGSDAGMINDKPRSPRAATTEATAQTEPRSPRAATDSAVSARGYNTTTRVWQREFFDHVLRSEESYAEKWEYVRQNPVRAGLTARVEDWPYQGEVHPL
ncbi:MAG: transposase [Verrucomicrobiia bacterium]